VSAGPALAAVVFDYGGVITNPLAETLLDFCTRLRIEPKQLNRALQEVGAAWGESPMARLEVAGCTEAEMVAAVAARLPQLGDRLGGKTFGEHWFRGRRSELAVLTLISQVRELGLRTALLTNNVREWAPRWQAQVDPALFDLVVDSSVEGVRKPDPEIYRRTVARLGVAPEQILFVDDLAENRQAAARLGLCTFAWADRGSVGALRDLIHTQMSVLPVGSAA
jgi:putative hydrolase of the HAD superfamily